MEPSIRFLERASSWLPGDIGPWICAQMSAVSDQLVALTISATVGGLISWGITRQADKKARKREVAREASFRHSQMQRDEQRNLFEYRNWRAASSRNTSKEWEIKIDTKSPHRDNWVLTATPKSKRPMHKVRFIIGGIQPEKQSFELTQSFASAREYHSPSGVEWVKEGKAGHWKSDPDSFVFFSFSIGDVIDNADTISIFYVKDEGGGVLESHPISPFDSMKDYRPWSAIESDGKG